MAGTGGASMVETQGNSDSENGIKRLKSGDGEGHDRITALPDFLIHRILSLLPATDLIKTMVLSKSWQYQWTHVPDLKFVSNEGMSLDKFSNFIDKTLTLHDCCNIEKLEIKLKCYSTVEEFPNLDSWILFAMRKCAKELIVHLNEDIGPYSLPDFVFSCSWLVKLKLSYCDVMPVEKVNWGFLKSLCLYDCSLDTEEGIENVLSGSPQLEYLELRNCNVVEEFVVASKSLKTLILDSVDCRWSFIEISCPNLERLRISGLVWFTSLKLMNLRSSAYVTLDFLFEHYDSSDEYMSYDERARLVQQTLWQVQHVEKLEIGGWLMEMLSSFKEEGECIGGFPDFFIQRIMSYFPSTKDAFKSDQYRMGQRSWNDVPILYFVSKEKFVIYSEGTPLVRLDPRLLLWIRFAAKKDVKEMILDCDGANVDFGYEYTLPQFLFNNSPLVKLMICACRFTPNEKVNWESLKSLHLEHSELGDQAIEHVLSGSPLLENLELRYCGFQGALVVASQHLKTFIVEEFGKSCHLLEISCPNLESLIVQGDVASTRLKLMNLPSSLHAAMNFYVVESDDISPNECLNSVEETINQILHVEELEFVLRRLKS